MTNKNDYKKKVLIVEDNKLLCEMFKIAFHKNGFDIEISLEGENGIKKISVFKPDLVLLDIMMPGEKNGFDVLKEIRKNMSLDVPVIVNSNMTQDKDIEKALKLGANKYLKKSDYTPNKVVEEAKNFV